MKKLCQKCKSSLPKFRLFRVSCRQCGAKYKAVRRSEGSFLTGLYGMSGIFFIPAGFFLPAPLWFRVVIWPLLYIAGAIFLAMLLQEWRIQDKSE